VSFLAAPADQDGYAYVAVKVWTGDVEPPQVVPVAVRSVAYESTLTLGYDDPRPSSGGGTASP
jgi:CspA family cold shock protein